ncbi:MAG: hypothetical protein Q8O55_04130 [Dehalococcoidales bacterium]|nr:hypothetical protein [Dehalococcoidales bacterium]
MRKWSIITLFAVALLGMIVSPVAAFAQTGDSEENTTPPRDGLAIVAPLATPINTQISITVFQCSDQEPVEGAGVWLVTREEAENLRQEMAKAKRNANPDTSVAEYENMLGIHGTFIARTNSEGKVWYSFETSGRYVLVAILGGYVPDSRPIAVGMHLPALAIDAPPKAQVDENITITVFQRGTEDPVKDAGVWAFTREDAAALKERIASIRESGDKSEIDAALEEAVNTYGIFLGTTNGAGKVKYAFEKAGGYLLVTRKEGFSPARKPIVILPEPEPESQARPATRPGISSSSSSSTTH